MSKFFEVLLAIITAAILVWALKFIFNTTFTGTLPEVITGVSAP